MSFASDAKLVVLNETIESDCCSIAFLSGIIKSCGQLNIKSKGISVEVYTELEGVYDEIIVKEGVFVWRF